MVADNGLIMEGLSSNFFGVMQGSLYTADEGVLPGITRSLVLEEAELANVPVKLTGIPLDKLHTIDECFITSASRAVLPVVEIDDVVIQNGKPGPITQILRSRYLQRIKVEAQDI